MKLGKQTISALATIGLLMLSQLSGIAKSKQSDSEALRDARKADYLFIEALKYKEEGQHDAYYDMVARAYELNPTDVYLGNEYGIKLLFDNNGDSIAQERGLAMMRRYVDQNPTDVYATVNYASIASQLGHSDDALSAWSNLYKHNIDRTDVAATYADALAATRIDSNMRKALKIYDDVENVEGVNATLSVKKMQILHSMNDTTAVKREAKNLLSSSPNSVEYTTLVGTVYAQLGDNDSALVYFDKALEIDPTSGLAYYNRAKFFDQLGDSVAYDREVFNALRQPDLELDPKLEILRDYVAKLYADTTQHARIEELYKSLIDQYPYVAEVRGTYSLYFLAIGNYTRAAEEMAYALDADPSNKELWSTLASIYYQQGEYKKVKTTALDALRYFPEEISMYEIASSACVQDKDYDGAKSILETALEVADSTDNEVQSELISSMGDMYYASGQPDSAFVQYTRAIALNPNNLLALNNCAYHMACEEKDLEQALKMIEKVVIAKPDDDTSLDTYAWVLFKMKNYTKAKEQIDRTLEVCDEPSAELLEHAGDIYFMNGLPDEALSYWQKALALDPTRDVLNRKVKHKTFFFK